MASDISIVASSVAFGAVAASATWWVIYWRRVSDPVNCGGCETKAAQIRELYRQLDALGRAFRRGPVPSSDDWAVQGIGVVDPKEPQ